MAIVTIEDGVITYWDNAENAYRSFITREDEGAISIIRSMVRGEQICMDRPYGLGTLLKAKAALIAGYIV